MLKYLKSRRSTSLAACGLANQTALVREAASKQKERSQSIQNQLPTNQCKYARTEYLETRVLFAAMLPVVTDLQLVQAPSGARLSTLIDGSTVNATQLGSFSLRANTTGQASKVIFVLDGKTLQTETGAPYDIHGDTSGNPIAWAAPLGSHQLVVTPYLNSVAGTSDTVSFSVVNTVTIPLDPSPIAPPSGSLKLDGTLIGTVGSYAGSGNTLDKAIDGDSTTFFDAPTANGDWVGFDLGSAYQITQVQYVPRAGLDSRMVGGLFQGSNTADFSAGVTNLFTITTTPTDKVYTAQAVTINGGFQYVRYLSPANGYGNVAEIEFDGSAVTTTQPTDPTTVPAPPVLKGIGEANEVDLSWTENSSSSIDSFIIQRKGPEDADYVVLNSTDGNARSLDDFDVMPDTTYSYIIIANNSLGSSDPSDPISVTTEDAVVTSPTSPALPPDGSSKLTGTLIGTSGSYSNSGNTISKAIDGNLNTFFDAPNSNGAWVGYDLKTTYQITQVQYVPRDKIGSRMVGGMFQGSNSADFSTGVVTLLTITAMPKDNVYTNQAVTPTGGFRYVRYLSPNGGHCNVSEVEFDGLPGTASPVTQTFPTKISWTNGAPSPIVRAEAVGQTVNGKVYVFGGFNAEGSVDTSIPLQHRCDVYDPATNKWTRLKDFPEPFTHSQGVVAGTDIWFVGGYVGNHPGPGTTHVWVYHTTNDTWTRGPDLPQARGAGAAALVGNTIYFSGGMNQQRNVDESTTYALDLTNQSKGWAQKANNPNARNHVAAASVGGYFYLLGGQRGQEENQAAQSEVDRYDPSTNAWTKMASLPTNAGKSHITEGTLVYNGRIIVVGGETGYNATQRYIVDYDPTTNKWTQLGLLPAARSTVVAGIVNGKLIVTTGNSPNPTTTTWIGTLS